MKKRRSPKRLEIDPPPGTVQPLHDLASRVAPVAKRLGFSVYLVGGAVRDLLEGRDFTGEWDLVVFSDDGSGATTVAWELARSWKCRDPIVFPRFGTFLVVGKNYQAEIAEACLRTTIRPLTGDPLVDDSLSRDFTLNALYIDLVGLDPVVSEHRHGIEVIDPSGQGFTDLEAGLLRTPVPAKLTLTDDPLRIFRAARLRTTRSYRISAALSRAAKDFANILTWIAPERIFDEMNRIMLSQKPSAGLYPLGHWGVFADVMPEIHEMVGFRQDSPYHFPDLFRHSLRVVDKCRGDLALRWAALLHDCGKPDTKISSQEGDNYYGHEKLGSELAEKVLKRLKAGRRFTREVGDLVGLHMVHYGEQWSDRAVRRLRKRAGIHLEKLLELVEADSASLRLRKQKLQDIANLKRHLDRIGDNFPSLESPLGGNQIMQVLGVSPGPWVGIAKKVLAEAVGEGVIPPDEDAAESYLIKWWKEVEDRSF